MTEPEATGRYRRHSDVVWTSFDRFGRYGRVAEILGGLPGDGPVVDVGDRSGYLRRFLPTRSSIAFDLDVEPAPFDDVVFGIADGTRLPVADDTFDAAVCCDVLEHLPADTRPELLGELGRVARRCLVVAAPFDTVGVAGVESLAARFAAIVHGAEQPQLTEHAERGLPDLTSTAESLAKEGWDVRIEGEGNLYDWLGLMLLRFGTENSEGLRPLGDGLDIFYNSLLAGRSSTPPFYRHILVATPGGGTVTGLDEALEPGELSADSVSGALISQLGLINLVPRLNDLERRLDTLDPMVAGHLVNVVGRSDQQHLEVMERLRILEQRSFRGTAGRWWRRLRPTERSAPPDAADGTP